VAAARSRSTTVRCNRLRAEAADRLTVMNGSCQFLIGDHEDWLLYWSRSRRERPAAHCISPQRCSRVNAKPAA
jgi:hypothetical protein